MFKLYNIVCPAVLSKLRDSQIPVGLARTGCCRWQWGLGSGQAYHKC